MRSKSTISESWEAPAVSGGLEALEPHGHAHCFAFSFGLLEDRGGLLFRRGAGAGRRRHLPPSECSNHVQLGHQASELSKPRHLFHLGLGLGLGLGWGGWGAGSRGEGQGVSGGREVWVCVCVCDLLRLCLVLGVELGEEDGHEQCHDHEHANP